MGRVAIPIISRRAIGNTVGNITRMAVSYTPAAAMTLRHFSFVAARIVNRTAKFVAGLAEVTSIDWEIRTGAAAGDKPNTTAASLKDSGSFDWRYTSGWKVNRPIKHTINLTSGLELTAATRYWVILKMAGDEDDAYYPLAWADTYETGAAGEVDAAVYSSEYIAGTGWQTGDNSYNLTLYILDAQAGENWHCVVNSIGYMQPDKMRGYRCEQMTSGLAQSRGGQSEYSQLRAPYSNMSQSNWSGGTGQLVMDDPMAFQHAFAVDSAVPNQLIVSPKVNLTGTDSSSNPAYEPTQTTMRPIPDAQYSISTANVTHFAQKFTAPAGGLAAVRLEICSSRMPDRKGFKLYLALYSNIGGAPGALLDGWDELTTLGMKPKWVGTTIDYALVTATDYWIVVKSNQTWGPLPEFQVLFDQDGSAAGGAAKCSYNGTTWVEVTGYSMAFRINYGIAGALDGTVKKMVYGVVNGTAGLFALAGKEVYKWDATNSDWDPLTAALTVAGTDLIVFNNYLFVAQGYANDGKKYLAGWAGDGDAYGVFHISKGWLWASDSATTIIHKNAHGGAWSASITVGPGGWDITAMITYSGRLLIGREDGIWEVDDQDLARQYLMFREHADPNNCVGWAVWSGMLFIPVQNSIWRWQGSQYREVGPTDKRTGPTRAWPNKIGRMTATAPMLIAAGTPVPNGFYGGLMAYNGMGWHNITIATQPNKDAHAICVTTELGTDETRIWMGEGDRITYVKYPTYTNNRYDWPSAKFSVHGGAFVTSWWDGGLKDALKFWNRVTLIADIPSGTSIQVWAAKDGEDWETSTDHISLGGLTAQQQTDTGEYVLMFPDGLIAKSIQLIFGFTTTDEALTPRLKAFNIESIVRQIPVYTYTCRLLLANNITKMDRTTESTRTASTMWEELQRASYENAPIILSFPGKSIRGMVSYLREETMAYKADGMEDEAWERVAVLTVIEAT